MLKDDISFKGIDAGFSSFRHRPNGINPCKLLSRMASADESDDEEPDESVLLNEMITTEQEALSEVSDTHDYSEARCSAAAGKLVSSAPEKDGSSSDTIDRKRKH